MIMRLVKKAPIPTRMTTDINAGLSTIERAASAEINVPKMPAIKQEIWRLRHFDKTFDSVYTAKNTAITRMTKVKTANPNAIHTAVTILGINPNANNMPMITPMAMLVRTPINPQAVELYFPL